MTSEGTDDTPEQIEEEELFEHHRLEVDPNQSSIRIDKFLMERLPNVSRNKVQNAIRDEFIKVNEKGIKSNYKVRPGDIIVISLPEPPRSDVVEPENIPLDIKYEDETLLVVNKPAGMVVHPAYQNWTGTLVNALVHHFQQLPEMEGNAGRPGLVHRIDKDTSGLMVIAKTEAAMTHLAKQFFDHSIERTYYGLVWGVPSEEEGTIDFNLGRSPKDRRVITRYNEGQGQTAITHYKVLEDLQLISLVQFNLETGRTHQIRAHAKLKGFPLFNDATYGGNRVVKGPAFSKFKAFVDNCFKVIPRQALHAKTIGFKHPSNNEFMQFDSELPEDFQNALDKWRHYLKYNEVIDE